MPPKAAPWEGRFSKKIYIGRYAHTRQPAQAAASPEGEGREQAIADMRDYCLSTHEGWPIAKRYDALRQSAAPSGGDLARLREAGWMVAVHNDYRLNGEFKTFWLMVKDGRAIKGEGSTDEEALAALAQESKTGAVKETK